MKLKILLVVIVAVVSGFLLKNFFYQSVRGIEITVIDDYTGKPLSGVVVYYSLEKGQVVHLVDTTFYRIYETKFETDINGFCKIPERSYFVFHLNDLQFLSSDIITVNIDVNDEIKKTNQNDSKAFWSYFTIRDDNNIELFYNKNENYGGFVIYSQNSTFEKKQNLNRRVHYYRHDLFYNYNLTGNTDRFTIRLKRKKS